MCVQLSVLIESFEVILPQSTKILGEALYPLVDELEHDVATKIIGLLLEMDQPEVLHLIESPDAFMAKVVEAMNVLRNVAQPQAN
ncbi:Polyadenylate-binding protein 4 [Spatholobus suberectus]|nr:Polyadenylate-binding protein 4 [Spatholobus suberectus]